MPSLSHGAPTSYIPSASLPLSTLPFGISLLTPLHVPPFLPNSLYTSLPNSLHSPFAALPHPRLSILSLIPNFHLPSSLPLAHPSLFTLFLLHYFFRSPTHLLTTLLTVIAPAVIRAYPLRLGRTNPRVPHALMARCRP
ncbi:hypothetical protein R3P38DRAFT_3210476 [Favolaschia claudopus]|uniref:Uncharacterized protein n=1 Tax=Favolaschia claudopus TaxID=2862362 RepID=A0AAW0AGJ3_9AGAR